MNSDQPGLQSQPTDDPQEPADLLGAFLEEFRPDTKNLIAGVILSLAMIIGGIALALWLALRDDPKPLTSTDEIVFKWVFIALFGIGLPIGGFFLLAWVRKSFSHRVLLCEKGLAYDSQGQRDYCLWDQTETFIETLKHEQLKVLKIPGAAIHNLDRSLIIKRKDGRVFEFTVNTIKGLPRLLDHLKEVSRQQDILWQTVEV